MVLHIMSDKELSRLEVLRDLTSGRLTVSTAAELMGLERRQVQCLNKAAGLHGDGMTQFGRALKALTIEIICANSSQAKGRVERANKTLQDRLVKELRLAGIRTMEAGNVFLPTFMADYNARFAKAPFNDYELGRRFENGIGVDKDLRCAVHWYYWASITSYEVDDTINPGRDTNSKPYTIKYTDGLPRARNALKRLKNAGLITDADLGSGLIDQSQKMTVAAMVIAEKKV